jgi:ribA/ribD-fused uncharacterized protein
MTNDKLPQIDAFRDQYRFLSNFWPCEILSLDGDVYPSVEHAYQACKFSCVSIRSSIRGVATAGEAKRIGRRGGRMDWDRIKLSVMEALLLIKFCPGSTELALLKATAGRELVEGNTWGDVYWGVCGGVGENHLGKLLMKIRSAELLRRRS